MQNFSTLGYIPIMLLQMMSKLAQIHHWEDAVWITLLSVFGNLSIRYVVSRCSNELLWVWEHLEISESNLRQEMGKLFDTLVLSSLSEILKESERCRNSEIKMESSQYGTFHLNNFKLLISILCNVHKILSCRRVNLFKLRGYH
jgi:hypothetical protein